LYIQLIQQYSRFFTSLLSLSISLFSISCLVVFHIFDFRPCQLYFTVLSGCQTQPPQHSQETLNTLNFSRTSNTLISLRDEDFFACSSVLPTLASQLPCAETLIRFMFHAHTTVFPNSLISIQLIPSSCELAQSTHQPRSSIPWCIRSPLHRSRSTALVLWSQR
jgi:hypothetical protein